MTNTDTSSLHRAKQLVWQYLNVFPGNSSVLESAALGDKSLESLLSADCDWHCFHPINALKGFEEIQSQFCRPLLQAIPNLERRIDTFFGGDFDGRFCGGAGTWVTATGYWVGTMENDWLGIPATGDTVYVRVGEFFRVENEKIVDVRVLIDFVDLMRQAGYPVLPPSSGLDLVVPGPQYSDGILHHAADPVVTAQSMAALDRMMGGLRSYKQNDLTSMNMENFWHPDMMWYGPCGIGTSRQVQGFQKHHQQPFLHAFPDRVGGNHVCRIAEGDYIASTGWPSVRATHMGSYLGEAASNKPITMRVADWWRCDGNQLRENWVMIDLPDLFLQFGVDLFARMCEQIEHRK